MTKVCINAANLHAGGGVQVATSFIYELSMLDFDDLELTIFASRKVCIGLHSINTNVSVFSRFEEFDIFGLGALSPKNIKKFCGFDMVFTIFGPNYLPFPGGFSMTGFAQPWIIYPHNEVYSRLSLLSKLRTRLKFLTQALFFSTTNILIVELDHVRDKLKGMLLFKNKRIYIVRNCLSALYFNPASWLPCPTVENSGRFKIGFVGRDYPHKNTDFLVSVRRLLRSCYDLDVDFYVTFSEREWLVKSDDFRSEVNNIGELAVAQCPAFYQQMDAAIFPSFLECFSAMPLEVLVMNKPLFASDRGFVRDVCGHHARYFDPTDPRSAAVIIANYISNDYGNDGVYLTNARKHVVSFSNAKHRAVNYLSIMRKVLNQAD